MYRIYRNFEYLWCLECCLAWLSDRLACHAQWQ